MAVVPELTGGSAMPHEISLSVRADVGRDAIEIAVTGCLTRDTCAFLADEIEKAFARDPEALVLVDVDGALHLEPAAVRHVLEAMNGPQAGHRRAGLRVVGTQHERTCLVVPVEAP
ncbi:hypothetical protein [Brachybacterium phenoliresistens]|uniref:hypothetical protein n=1 Tax=Brachybacterium phenoliresistens TaxID=396014 RepID=UPI0031DEEA01